MKFGQEELKRIEDIANRARAIQTDVAHSRHLPAECYASNEVYQLEKANLFSKEWIIVGREEQLQKAGDYFTLRLAEEPILVTRGKDGKVHAFFNVCRHRGVEVAFRSGNRKNFSCPYHGWVYSPEGQLLDAPLMEAADGFDKSTTGLNPISVATWGGFVFVNLDPNAMPFQEKLGKHLARMDFLKIEDCQIADVLDYESPCNWKLIIENVMDSYHVALLHASTLGQVWDDESVKEELLEHGNCYAQFKNPTMTQDGKSLFGNLPWLPELSPLFANSLTISPTTVVFGRSDCMIVFHAHPIGPNKVRSQIQLLLPKQHASLPDYKERVKPYMDFMATVFEEDREMLESIQAAYASQKFIPGQLAPLEVMIRNYLDNYVNLVFGKKAGA